MSRSTILILVTLIAFASSLVSLELTRSYETFALRGYVDPTSDPNLPFRVPRLGVNADLEQYSADTLESQLAFMEANGIVWVRQFAYWNEIEPLSGTFNWDTWDRLAAAFARHNQLRLIAVLMNTPSWARYDSEAIHTSPPTDNALFARFAGEFAKRYGNIIDHYQIWDEPNLRETWGGLNPNPSDYASLLAATYGSIHSMDSNATVIAAALAPTTEFGPHNINELQYLHDLYAAGAGPYFDAVAGKPYGFNSSPLDRTVDDSSLNFSRIVAIREMMVEQGDSHKAVWAMNWGWNHLPEDWTGRASIWGEVSLAQQIQYTLQSIDRVEREWPWLAGMVIQHWQPDADLDNPIWGFSLLKPDGNPTNLLEAIQNHPTPSSASNGLFEPSTKYATYTGVWTFGPLGADSGWVDGSQAALTFEGTNVALLLREGNYVGYIYPQIDGQRINKLPYDNAGNPYIVLTSGSGETETTLTTIADNLPYGNYTLKLIADRGWDQWPLVSYAVSDSNLREPYKAIYSVSLLVFTLSGILAGGLVTVRHWQRLLLWNTQLSYHFQGRKKWLLGATASIALLFGLLGTWGEGFPSFLRREPVHIIISIITAGLIYVQISFAITLVAIAILWWLIFYRIEIGLALTMFWAPFFLFPVELYQFSFPLSEVIILITISAWLSRLLIEKLTKSKFVDLNSVKHLHLIDILVLIWVILGFLSIIWSEYRSLAITELRVKFIEPAFFYLILRVVSVKSLSSIRYCLYALISAGTIVSLIGIFQFVQGQGIITAEAGALRMASVYGSPNNLALFLGRCLPFVFAGLLIASQIRLRIVLLVIMSIMVATVILSQSAGALFIGLPASAAIVGLLSLRKRGPFIIIALSAICILGITVAMQSPRFSRLLDFSSGTNFYRLRVWESAIDMIQDYPITGIGLDQFLNKFRGEYIRPDAWQEPNLSHPHNIVLDFWLQLGIGGLFVLVFIQYGFWKSIWQPYRIHQNSTNRFQTVLIIGAIGSMTNLITHGLIDNSVYVNDLVYVFMFLIAIAANENSLQLINDANK